MVTSHNPDKYHTMSIPMPLDTYELLRMHAHHTRVSMSEHVRLAVADYLKRWGIE